MDRIATRRTAAQTRISIRDSVKRVVAASLTRMGGVIPRLPAHHLNTKTGKPFVAIFNALPDDAKMLLQEAAKGTSGGVMARLKDSPNVSLKSGTKPLAPLARELLKNDWMRFASNDSDDAGNPFGYFWLTGNAETVLKLAGVQVR